MSNSDDRRDQLERELDGVLRALAGGEGPADMRTRVLARLARPSPVVSWPVWAAAAAVLVLASVAGWRASRTERTQGPSVAASRPSLPPGPSPEPSTVPSASPPAATRAATARPTPPPRAATASDDGAPALPLLSVPEPITMARLEPPRVELEPIDVKPLVVPDLAVAPLEASGEPEHERKE